MNSLKNSDLLQIRNLSKSFRSKQSNVVVFQDFSLSIKKGEFVSILGPNGCGKTTLLNIIASVDKADKGQISFNELELAKPKIGFVFQDSNNSLFPWLTVEDNISFPLKIAGALIIDRIKKTRDICKKFGDTLDLSAFPYELSGGQQQLVSILRSLVIEPDLLLLDEPFSSLDYETKLLLLEKLSYIWRAFQITTIFISHDVDDAILLAQKIIVLSEKPTTILAVFENQSPFPRNIEWITSLEFSRLKSDILDVYLHSKKG